MKNYIKSNKKGILLVLIGFVFLGTLLFAGSSEKTYALPVSTVKKETPSVMSVPEPETKQIYKESEQINDFFYSNQNTINFLAATFKINQSVLIDNLKKDIDFDNYYIDNFGAYLVDYLFDLEQNNKKLFNNKITPCKDSKEYMVAVIKFFTQIYPDVDFSIAAAIANVESNYEASTMLKKNNIFGGMSNGGLIKYKSIEYGILKYIKLLNDGYFTQGLTTVEAIGKVYNPTVNEEGKKIASPTWVVNVNRIKDEYVNYPDVDINLINSLKNKD